MKLLLREQPVASDLRRISSALKIVYDMLESRIRRVRLLRLSYKLIRKRCCARKRLKQWLRIL